MTYRSGWRNIPKKKKRKFKKKYKKQVQRMKKNNASPHTKTNRQMRQLSRAAIQKTLLFHEGLVEDIRNKYRKSTGGEGKTNFFANIITGKVLKKYRLQCFAQNSLGFSKKRWKNEQNGKVHYTYQRKQNNRVADGLISKVRAFYFTYL